MVAMETVRVCFYIFLQVSPDVDMSSHFLVAPLKFVVQYLINPAFFS